MSTEFDAVQKLLGKLDAEELRQVRTRIGELLVTALNPGEVPVKDLAVGDIVEENHQHWTQRKIVVKITDKSAVLRTDNGQEGRAARTVKRKGQVVDNRVTRIGHYDLTPDVLQALGAWYTMGDLRRGRWERGLLKELPPFHEIFGYEKREDRPFTDSNAGETVEEVKVGPANVRVRVKRYDNEKTYVEGKPVDMTCWGASVVDPDYDHEFGSLGWRYRDQDTARKAISMLDLALTRGHDLETATWAVCQAANDSLPKIDRWRSQAES